MECKCGTDCKPANEILEALDLLHRTYPDERVDIWCGYSTAGELRYSALVGDDDSVYGCWQDTPMKTAEQVIDRAGDRSKLTRLNKRIAALKAEITELEASNATQTSN